MQPHHLSQARRGVSRTVGRCALLIGAISFGVSCTGTIGDGENGGPGAAASNTANPSDSPPGGSATPPKVATAAAPVRRLTREEYNNTVHDLLGDTTRPATSFVADGTTGIFHTNKDTPVSALIASQYQEAAEQLAATATATIGTLVPCAAGPMAKEACARQFIESFGKRAYRRPLKQVEVDRYSSLYASSTTGGADFTGAIRVIVEAMLQSPYFLNHVEKGDP